MTKARDLANASTALSAVDATELGYLDGVTSAVQTQLNAKQPTVANVSDTEIGYLDGVTSAIQTQLNAKQAVVSGVDDTEIGYLNGVTSAIQTQLNQKPEVVAGKNFLINGNFDIFQRTSFASQTITGYSLDRWLSGVGGTVTITQQTTGVPIGSQYCMRTAYNGAGGNYANQHNNLELAMTKMLAGKTVTFSVLIRANAAYVATSSQGIQIAIDKNSTANTGVGGSWSSINSTTVLAASIPTGTGASDWYKVTVTAAIPNDGTADGLRVRVGELVTGPSGAYWEMAQAQLEVGSVATPFSRAGGSIQGELAACQRYYFRQTALANYSVFATGQCGSSTTAQMGVRLPVTMRTYPSAVEYSTLRLADESSGYTVTSMNLNTSFYSADYPLINVVVASGLTPQRFFSLGANNSSSAYLGLSAEL